MQPAGGIDNDIDVDSPMIPVKVKRTIESEHVRSPIAQRRLVETMNAVFFQLCNNVAVATDGHRLHAIEIQSTDDGDFLVPRRAIELVENIRKATRTPEL